MDRIDPNYLMDKFKVRSDCPSDIRYLATWIKAMVICQDVNLTKTGDIENLKTFFEKWANTSSPQKVVLNMEVKPGLVKVLVERAIDWLIRKEVLE